MAGSTEGIKAALRAVQERTLCEFGLPLPGTPAGASKRVQVTGAIILGVIEGLEQQVARDGEAVNEIRRDAERRLRIKDERIRELEFLCEHRIGAIREARQFAFEKAAKDIEEAAADERNRLEAADASDSELERTAERNANTAAWADVERSKAHRALLALEGRGPAFVGRVAKVLKDSQGYLTLHLDFNERSVEIVTEQETARAEKADASGSGR